MPKLKRIKTERFRTSVFWIEKRGEEYIAYRSFINAVLGIASPSIMSIGKAALKLAYEAKKL